MESRERTRVGMAGGAAEPELCDRKHFRRIVQFLKVPFGYEAEHSHWLHATLRMLNEKPDIKTARH